MDNTRLLLIGGSGFIGTYLIDTLDNQYEIHNLDKRESLKYNSLTDLADIRDFEALNGKIKGNFDWVVLLAAEHRDDVSPVSLYYDVNVEGTRNVLKAMNEKGINKIIFTSSVAIYGLNKDNPDINHPADPFNDYGKSKWQAEELLREWRQMDPERRTLIIVRPTVVFGPGNRGNVYNLLKQIAGNKFLMVGSGENKKSMAYVENIAAFLKYCIQSNSARYQVFNYVDTPDLTTRELVDIAEKALGKKLPPYGIPYWLGYAGGVGFDILSKMTRKKYPISSVRVKKFCATTQFSAKAIKANTNFKPTLTLKDGLTKTIQNIATNNDQAIGSGNQ